MTKLDRVPCLDDKGRVRAVIESPQASRYKFKYDPSIDQFTVHASLPAGMAFPFDFGFFPRTEAADGDPLDVLVLMDAPAFPGVVVRVRLLGVLEAEQSDDGGKPYRNDRIIALAEGNTERGDLHKLSDLNGQLMEQIASFFATYASLRGKSFTRLGHRGPRHAHRLLRRAAKHYDRPRAPRRRSSGLRLQVVRGSAG
jgi:inorganic pyrophosphatase